MQYDDSFRIELCMKFLFYKQDPAYEMRVSDWSSDVCSSDLHQLDRFQDLLGALLGQRNVPFDQLSLEPLQQCPVSRLRRGRLEEIQYFAFVPGTLALHVLHVIIEGR